MYGVFSPINLSIPILLSVKVSPKKVKFLFYEKNTINNDISNWNVSSVTNMNSMFYGADNFTI